MSGFFVNNAEIVKREDGTELTVYWATKKGGKDKEIGIAFDGGYYNIARQSQAESMLFAAEIGENMVDDLVKGDEL